MKLVPPDVVIEFEPWRRDGDPDGGNGSGYATLLINGDRVRRVRVPNERKSRRCVLDALQLDARKREIDFKALRAALKRSLRGRVESEVTANTALALAHAFVVPWALQFDQLGMRIPPDKRVGRRRVADEITRQVWLLCMGWECVMRRRATYSQRSLFIQLLGDALPYLNLMTRRGEDIEQLHRLVRTEVRKLTTRELIHWSPAPRWIAGINYLQDSGVVA